MWEQLLILEIGGLAVANDNDLKAMTAVGDKVWLSYETIRRAARVKSYLAVVCNVDMQVREYVEANYLFSAVYRERPQLWDWEEIGWFMMTWRLMTRFGRKVITQ